MGFYALSPRSVQYDRNMVMPCAMFYGKYFTDPQHVSVSHCIWLSGSA